MGHRRLAIIGAGSNARLLARQARKMGLETHAFAWRRGAVAADEVDAFHDVSVTDTAEIVRTCRELGVAGVVPSSEFTIHPASLVTGALGLVGNDPRVTAEITNKYRNRDVSAGVEGLKQPRYWHISNLEEVRALDVPLPLILKPTAEAGKRGIIVIRDAGELERALAYAASEPNRRSEYIVEEFLPPSGEYSVETLSFHGEHHVIQIEEMVCAGPHCVQLCHHEPARLTSEMRGRIEALMPRALDSIGVQNGPCHTELKIVGDDIYLIEFNPRIAGDHISEDLVRLSTGYEFLEGVIRVALDEFEPPQKLEHWYAGICYVTQLSPQLKPLFDSCEEEPWCWKRHQVSADLQPYEHNGGESVNYFIYQCKDKRPDFILDLCDQSAKR